VNLYLAGQRTGLPDYNRAAFTAATARLRAADHEVISPAELDGAEEGMVAGGTGAVLPEDVYLRGLRKCVASMLTAEAVAVLDGWERSRGAALEVRTARELGLPILRYPDLAPVAPRHPNSDRFHAILRELGDLHDRKQLDYGRDDDPFANVRSASDWGVDEWVGAMVRATDKVRRLQTFARRGTLANEGVVDAFDDLAVYAVIARVLYEEQASSRETPPA
jgi:hypothetical protein